MSFGDVVMSRAKLQGNLCDEVATQIKKHLQLAEEMFNSLCLRNESYNEIQRVSKRWTQFHESTFQN